MEVIKINYVLGYNKFLNKYQSWSFVLYSLITVQQKKIRGQVKYFKCLETEISAKN